MANKSRRVYQEYQEALEATKVQYKALNEDASITFRDATMNALQNGLVYDKSIYDGEKSAKTLFLQGVNDGKICITPAIAEQYGLSESEQINMGLDEYLYSLGYEKHPGKIISPEIPAYDDPDWTEIIPGEPGTPPGEPIPAKLNSFDIINNIEIPGSKKTEYNPIDNKITALSSSQTTFSDSIDITFKEPPSGCKEVSEIETIDELNGYESVKISTIESLLKLQELSANNSVNCDVILANDIDFNDYSGNYEWFGICLSNSANGSFNGTFYGNGNKIKNLGQNGTANAGLFNIVNTDGRVIDLGLENVNIVGPGLDTGLGGITGNNRGIIKNCYVTGNISCNNTQYSALIRCGGIVGYNYGTVSYCNVNANISGNNFVGGIVGATSTIGNGSQSVRIEHCIAQGTLSAIGNIGPDDYRYGFGGLVGYVNSQSSDLYISFCSSLMNFEGDESCKFGSLVGCGSTNFTNGRLYVTDTKISSDIEDYNKIGYGTGQITDLDVAIIYDKTIETPSINTDFTGGFYSNIYGALIKSGMEAEDIDTQKIKDYISRLSAQGNEAVANINKYLYEYINDGINPTFINDLKNDIYSNPPSLSFSMTKYQNKYNDGTKYKFEVPSSGIEWTPKTTTTNSEVTIPSIKNIAETLYYSFVSAEKNQFIENVNDRNNEIDKIKQWIISNYDTNIGDDKAYLADINKYISTKNKTKISDIYNAYINEQKYISNPREYDPDEWTIKIATDTTINISYNPETPGSPGEEGTSDEIITHKGEHHDAIAAVIGDPYWDTSDKDIQNAMMVYLLSMRGIHIVTEEQASNYEYLKNILETGEAVLTTFDPKTATQLLNMTENEIIAMRDEEYNKLLGIENTNVAVETHLQEVADEKNLKKAEAKYEADMHLIDMKDRKYDRDLAALEAERNATKNEMETLKTVAKDNVDRTFKLFS